MLKPVEMAKVRAICLKAHAPAVIRVLHNLSLVHLKEAQVPETQRSGPLPSFDEISARLVKIRSLYELIGRSAKVPKRKIAIKDPVYESDILLSEAENFFALLKEKEELSKELDSISAAASSLAELEGMDIDFSALPKDSLQFALIRVPQGKEKAAREWLKNRKNCAYTSIRSGSASLFLVALPKAEETKPLEKFGSILPLPQISSTPAHELESLRLKESQLKERLSALQRKISRFIDSNAAKIAALLESLSIEAERARAATMFGSSQSLYFIEGWVEKSKLKQLAAELHGKFGKKVFLSEVPFDLHHELAPTKLENPKPAGPFQFLVDFLYVTNYRELDPTLIISFTIPILYALIFGDAGYAVFSALMAHFMIKKSKPGSLLNQIAKIWLVSAIPAFFIGVAFDEFFGFTHTHLLELFGFEGIKLYDGLHRVSSITTLMLICIIAGMLHLALGFILGAINEWNHSRKHAIAKLCWLGVEISGFFLVAAGMFGAFSEFFLPAAALFALSVAIMVLSEGAIAAVEIPGLASNIMSYIRIAAVGVGGVILAEAINELLLPRLELSLPGIFFFLVTLALYISLHAASCALAMFESFIHGARLNVVEFFGKFFKGNGIRFEPFAAKRVYSQEA